MSLDQAASILLNGLVKASTLRAAIYRKELAYYKIGKVIVTTPEDVHDWIDRCRVQESPRWAIEKIENNNFRCELTNIAFFGREVPQCRVNPFSPSLDRIVPSKGYTKDNIRIILHGMNVMLLDWGTDLFEEFSSAYMKVRG